MTDAELMDKAERLIRWSRYMVLGVDTFTSLSRMAEAADAVSTHLLKLLPPADEWEGSMRELKLGDVVRLRHHLPADTVRGVRMMESGWELEVASAGDGFAKVLDRNGVKALLPLTALEFVRSGVNPPDEPGPGGKRASKLPKRRGLTNVREWGVTCRSQ
jgi:hypothetical protein